ncbi:hypothetical protein ACHHYP_16995 [Achlya hypogyna]|uniref:Myb/SANT-like domain-containing protein n=1 Tax=Achlya hypogyna TaxID=1202772 RepID=A0A1V9Y5E5_ACHHY|nr:hypothetical protein ACHHYP_16995 [Achlya hypogyna]
MDTLKARKTKGKTKKAAESTTDAPTIDQAEPRDVVTDLVASNDGPTATDATETATDATDMATDTTPSMDTSKANKKLIVKEEPVVWCDESIAKLFELRYKSELAKKFNSKNNMQKNYANECLAAELSVIMGRTFTVRQINNKFSRLRTAWSTSKLSNPAATGNLRPTNPPSHYDIMLEYWSEKPGMQRETLASTDDVAETDSSEDDDSKSVVVLDGDSNEESTPAKKKHKTLSGKGKDRTGTKKPMAPGDAMAVGFSELKEGLVAMGEALARPLVQQAAPQGTATLDDVLGAIKTHGYGC